MNIIYNLAFLLLFQFLSCNEALEFPQASHLPDSQQEQKRDKAGTTNIVFRSTDCGQTWQDISEGLPEHVKDEYGIGRNVFFADDNGLYLTTGNGIYHSNPNSKVPFWKKEIYQIFPNFQEKRVRTVFETARGTLFIGIDRGLFKSTNSGKTWKHVHVGGLVMKIVESNGVLLATCAQGIIRSTDDGENWALVFSEGGGGIDVEHIKGGFAAITFNTQSNTRRVRTSYDGGKSWQPADSSFQVQSSNVPLYKPFSQVDPPDSIWHPINTGLQVQSSNVPLYKPFSQVDPPDSIWHPINTGLPEQAFITSIVQVGNYFFCGHPTGIFRSSDKGKTWKLILPSIKSKVFNLSVSGNVIYAIPRNVGC
jgi:photosystem II stability/assembly factor-like uncharacterized protein